MTERQAGIVVMGPESSPGVAGPGQGGGGDRLPVPVPHAPAATAAQAPGGVDLQLVTVDPAGRVPLRRSAEVVGWGEGVEVELTLDDGVLRFGCAPPRPEIGVIVRLDRRLRVQLPYGVRETTPFRPGARLAVLAVGSDRCVAVAPLPSLVDRLVRGL